MNKNECPPVPSLWGRIVLGYGDERNGVYLSVSLLNVIPVDLSSVSLSKAHQLAEMRGYRSSLFVLTQPTIKASLIRTTS